MIFAWPFLKTLAAKELNAARDQLVDILRNYQSYRQCPVILVFDAYKVKGNPGLSGALWGFVRGLYQGGSDR